MKRSCGAAAFWSGALAAGLIVSGCGKDETDFADLKGEVGVVPGNFTLRLGQFYRDKIDSLESRVNGVIPGLTAQVTRRFSSDESTGDAKGTRLSDMLKIKVPGTESVVVNQLIFTELTGLTGDNGPWFDVVDTEKYLKTPSYVPPAAGDSSFDQKMGEQYYLDMIRWKDGVAGADSLLAGAAPVVVAVLDTGVKADHEDLQGVMWKSTRGDTSGAVGYDAVTGKALSAAESADANGHGTHVAGIIGGQGRNGKGIHGVGYLPGLGGDAGRSITEIMNVKVLNDHGAGTSSMIADGIKWAVDQHADQVANVGSRAKQKLIINMSLGGPFDVEEYDYKKENGVYVFEDDMINYAASKNALLVVAAGNDSCGIGGSCSMYDQDFKKAYYYPCSYQNVLCVAASTHADKLAGFSNRNESVGIAAPGFQILSTIQTPELYGLYSGTSQATPVTAGAASVLWSLYPEFTAAEIKQILQKSAATVSEITASIQNHGRLDLKAALAYAGQLKAAGKKPSQMEPAAGTVSADKATPSTPPAGGADPDAPSGNATGANGPADKGEGSAKGCAVVGGGKGTAVMTLLCLLLPVLITLIRRREQSL